MGDTQRSQTISTKRQGSALQHGQHSYAPGGVSPAWLLPSKRGSTEEPDEGNLHVPHPERVIDKGMVKSVRRFLSEAGEPLMEYKGYFGKVEFDDEANIFHGEVINLRDVITFEGKTVEEIREAFHESIDDYLEFCAARGEDPEKPYSGSSSSASIQSCTKAS